MTTPQRLPIVNSDDGTWGDILRQYLTKEHTNDDIDNPLNGGHKTITIQPGTATAGTAPITFASGTLLSTPEAGALEYDGTNLYITDDTADRQTLVGTTAAQTITNKRIQPRVGTVTSSATPSINTDACDAFAITALATDITSMTTNLTGTPTDFQRLMVRITDDGTSRGITWGAAFDNGLVRLPAYTGGNGSSLRVTLVYDAASSKWLCDSVYRPAIMISGTATSNTTSVTLPTHQAGDIIIVYLHYASNGSPTAPAAGGTVPTWNTITNSTGVYLSCKVAYCVATASNHTSGTWTNTTAMMAIVIKNASPVTPIGGYGLNVGYYYGDPIIAPAVSMVRNDGSSMLLCIYGMGDSSSSASAWGSVPAGYTRWVATTYSKNFLCLNTQNYTTYTQDIGQTRTGNTNAFGITVEVLV